MLGMLGVCPAASALETEEMKLVAPDMPMGAQFGQSVFLDGGRLAVGAPIDSTLNSNQGSVYLFERDPGGREPWAFVTKIVASDGGSNDQFGDWVVLDGDRLVTSSWREDQVYVYERNHGGPGAWGEVTILQADDTLPGDQFGFATALQGDRMVASAHGADVGASNTGAAYVFERDGGGSWVQVAKLLPLDSGPEDFFGQSVALDGDRVVVGASSSFAYSAWVFDRQPDGTWLEVAKLFSGNEGEFGESVAVSGDTVAVGAWGEDHEENDTGIVYIYEENQGGPGAWGEVKRLESPNLQKSGFFGFGIVLKEDRIAVGANNEDGLGADSEGVVYVFERDLGGDDNWGEVAHLTGSDAMYSSEVGGAVGFDGETVVAGAAGDTFTGETADGAVYTFLLGPSLFALGDCPGFTTIGLAGSSPNELAGLIWSTAEGTSSVPSGSCVGLELGLDQPNVLSALQADANGEVRFDIFAPSPICGVWIQAVDLAACEASNVTTVSGN